MELTDIAYQAIKEKYEEWLGLSIDHRYYNKLWKDTTASFFHSDIDGIKFINFNGTACHANMDNTKGWDTVVDVIQSETSLYRITPAEHRLKFMDYVMNRSAFAGQFLMQDAESAIEDGFTVRHLHDNAPLTQAGLILTRALQNDYQNNLVKSWNLLVDAGLQEDIALVFAGYLVVVDNKIRVDSFHSIGHHWWAGDEANLGYLSNYINRNYHKHGSFHSGRTYSGVHNLFSIKSKCLDKRKIGVWLVDACYSTGKTDVPKEVVNPFAAAAPVNNSSYSGSIDKVLSCLVPLGNNFYKEYKE